jgi:hypothetical protein
MQKRCDRFHLGTVQCFYAAEQPRFELNAVRHAALDALDMRESAVVRDIGRLAGPRGNGTEARNDDKLVANRAARKRLAVGEQGIQPADVVLAERRCGIDEMQKPAAYSDDGGIDCLKLG